MSLVRYASSVAGLSAAITSASTSMKTKWTLLWTLVPLFFYGWGVWQMFGGRWLRGFGNVDEMYRSLSTTDLVKVERIDHDKVWGR